MAHALRILLADPNVTSSKRLSTYLQESGFEVHLIHDGAGCGEHILDFMPHFILIDLTLPNFTAFQCLDFLKKHNLLDKNECRVFVLSQHNAKQNVETCLQLGAADYMVKPVNPIDVLTRLALHLQAKSNRLKENEIKDKQTQQTGYYMQLIELFVKTLTVPSENHLILFQLLRMLSLAVNAVRISLISTEEDPPTVIASSDNDKFNKFQLAIEKYPEVDYVRRTQKPLFIENLKDDQMMAFIKEKMKSVSFNTMIVLPVMGVDGKLQGILSTRCAESSQLSDADIRLCYIVAQIVSVHLNMKKLAAAKTDKQAA